MNATIRKLTERDCEVVLTYLADEPAHTTFLVADIRDYGFGDERFTLWGAVSPEEHESFEYVFCRFYDCILVYSKSNSVDVSEICRFLDDNKIGFQTLSGKESLVMPFVEQIKFGKEHRCYLAELRPENFTPHVGETITTEWATIQDAEDIYRLRASMEEFQDILMPLEQLVDLLETGKGRVLNIREQGRIVSSATESCLGRIGYVCTAKEFRGRGYASLLVSKLSETILAEGLIPSLGYESLTAGRIYQRIGFREVGRTVILAK